MSARRYWYQGSNSLTRARDLCYSIGIKPPRGFSLRIPEWAEVIGRLAGGAYAARPGAKAALRLAALALKDDAEAQAALLAAGRLGGGAAQLKMVVAIAHRAADVDEEVLRAAEKERRMKRRADHARRMLAKHKRQLKLETTLVKKWAAKVRRYEKEGL